MRLVTLILGILSIPHLTMAQLVTYGSAQLNPDCLSDILTGLTDADNNAVPVAIEWGRDDNYRAENCPPDPETQSNDILRVAQTAIRYPAWQDLHACISFDYVNRDDAITDLLIYMRGTDTTGGIARDTARVVTVFGQSGLDTLTVLDLAAIPDGWQTEPFVALGMRFDIELINPARRDISGILSWELARPDLYPQSGQQAAPPPAEESAVRIYPNPTDQEQTTIEAHRLPAGEYIISLHGLGGREYRRARVTAGPRGTFTAGLDLAGLVTGYYLVRVTAVNGTYRQAYPIAVIR